MQILTIKDGKDFVITSAALPTDFSSYLPTFQKMIDSFAFIPVSTSSTDQSRNATTTSTPSQSSNKTYTNATDVPTIGVPQGWSIEEGQNKANDTDLKVVYLNHPIALDPEAAVSVTIYKDTRPPSNSSIDGYLRDPYFFTGAMHQTLSLVLLKQGLAYQVNQSTQ
jgi:hypothetical protein